MGDGFGAQLVGVALALLFVLVLAWVGLRLVNRVRAAGPQGGPALRVERSLAISARERLVVVRCADQELLLGVTAGSISLLQQWTVAEGRDRPAP
jgi:flagellar protein FliO/FliZ